jgi:protein-L-isoaspartate(D-aspartate) O-methyltransferase
MGEKIDFSEARTRMVKDQLRARGIRDAAVLRAMSEVPREAFVPLPWRDAAYDDRPLPIGADQTISQPYVVAAMTEALELSPTSRVLEIGTGSGYQSAVLAEIVGRVETIECFANLLESARRILTSLQYGNIAFHLGDGTSGWPAGAPYDAIIATCAAGAIPPAWEAQLAEGGRLVAPIGPRDSQHLLAGRKRGGRLEASSLMGVRFVPLLGGEGER